MNRNLFLLRLSYWLGAVFDGLMVIPMLSPQVGGKVFGIENFSPVVEYKFAMGIGASLMAGWTFLLIWADRKPMARKGVLILTIIPVLAGLILSCIYSVSSGFVKMDKMVPTWIAQLILVIIFSVSYFTANEEK